MPSSSDALRNPVSRRNRVSSSGAQFLALDLGTSFIKGAVLDLDALRLRAIHRLPFPDPLPDLPPLHCEIDPDAVLAATSQLIDTLLAHAPEPAGLVMTSQMQGLVLTDAAGQPVSNCITWRDQRALAPRPGGGTYFDALTARLSDPQRARLGELHAGLPFCALFRLAEEGRLPPGLVPASLPDFVLASLCRETIVSQIKIRASRSGIEASAGLSGSRAQPAKASIPEDYLHIYSEPGVEATNASVHGPLDLATLTWQEDILAAWGLERLRWPRVRRAGEVVGHLDIGGRAVPCYTPVGDQACAMVGALLQEGELSLNISTGSQASMISPALVRGDYQTRPFFDGRYLNLITHIPAGRALNTLVALLTELAEAEGVRLRDPWGTIARLAAETGLHERGDSGLYGRGHPAPTDLRVNLAFFASLRGDRGEIANIREDNLTVGHLFRAAFQDMAENYHACALRLSPAAAWERLVFSGGLALKMDVLRQVICDRFGAEQAPAAHRLSPSPEDTLLGLLALALAFTGRASSVAEASRLLVQHYREEEL